MRGVSRVAAEGSSRRQRIARRTACAVAMVLGSALSLQAEQIVVRGGTVVDVRSGELIQNSVVVVEGDRIVSVTQGGAVPSGATVLDATGKFVLPGLIDLHVHYDEWAGELYLNHGVTTVVDLANDYEWIREQKRGIDRGFVPGPRLFHSPPALDGERKDADGDPEFTKRVARSFVTIEDARAAMREYVSEGIDAVKVYDALTPAQLRGIVAEAERANLPVIGHFKDVRVAIEVGAKGIEHTAPVANALVDAKAREQALKQVRPGFTPPVHAFMDMSRMPEIVKLMVDSGVYLNPTMRGNWQGSKGLRDLGFPREDFDLLINDWRLRYVPLAFRLAVLKEYQEMGIFHWRDLSAFEQGLFEKGYENSKKLIKAFSDAGGKLYAGTDSAHMSTPGLSMHQELEIFVQAGISPLTALQAATINPATLMRLEDRLGTVEAGKVGDLVIVDANPLENIRNARKVWRVISRGKMLDGQYHADYKNPIPRNYWEDSSHYFPSPEIQSVNPGAIEAGRDAVLTVSGTGLIPYSIALFNGVKVKTEWVSRTELRAHVPQAMLQPGTYAVTVENPDFGWGSVSVGGHLAHLGIRDHISNEYLVMVKLPAAASLSPSGK